VSATAPRIDELTGGGIIGLVLAPEPRGAAEFARLLTAVGLA